MVVLKSQRKLFIQSPTKTQAFNVLFTSPQTLHFETSPTQNTNIPSDIIPANVTKSSTCIIIHSHTAIYQPICQHLTVFLSTPYFKSIDEWEFQLLQHVNIVNIDLLIKTLESKTTILLATDGGAETLYGSGSFGWVLATTSSILAENGGIALGRDPDSFSAKGYSILSVLLFLVLFVITF